MNASISSLLNPLKSFLGKYHSTMFFTCIVLLLAGAILSLYLATQESDVATGNPNSSIISTFDEKTADEIKKLRESTEASPNLVYPKPRSNPFVE